MTQFNEYVRRHFGFEFRIGVGVHYGLALIGQMGHPKKMQLTALGDTVNTASRIESLCKKSGADFLVSDAVRREAGEGFRFGRRFRTRIRGKSGEHVLHEVLSLQAGPASAAAGEATESAPGGAAPDLPAVARNALRRSINRDQAPGFLRLAYHDFANFNAATGLGGLDASIRFPEDYGLPENAGLEPFVAVIRQVHDELQAQAQGVSHADLIALAGALAVELCNGPRIPIELGRKDAPGPGGGADMPTEDSSFEHLSSRFRDMGLDYRDLVVLSGAHTIGRSAGRPFTDDFLEFDNSYFRLLLDGDPANEYALLSTDYFLVQREETRRYVEEYARDQRRFFQDFVTAYRKITRGSLPLSDASVTS